MSFVDRVVKDSFSIANNICKWICNSTMLPLKLKSQINFARGIFVVAKFTTALQPKNSFCNNFAKLATAINLQNGNNFRKILKKILFTIEKAIAELLQILGKKLK